MKRFVLALTILGLGAISYAATVYDLLPDCTTLAVLKGAVSDTVHYVRNDVLPDTPEQEALRAAYGVDAMGLAYKPKGYYYMVVEITYVPEIDPLKDKWTSEGDIFLWTMGVVEYGKGRHDANGVWDKNLLYANDVGGAVDVGMYSWWWTKKKKRAADAYMFSANADMTFTDQRDGIAELAYAAKLIKDKVNLESWYEPKISSLLINYSRLLQQLVDMGDGPAWMDMQMGTGKVKFSTDSTLTKILMNAPDIHTGLGLVAAEIQAKLIKGGYPAVLPDLDPFNDYP